MGKISIIIYITVGLFVLFLISHSPNKHPNTRHRRLKLRSNFNIAAKLNRQDRIRHQNDPDLHQHGAFDPVVADMERRREDKEWEKQYFEHSHPELVVHHDSAPEAESQPEWEDFINAEDYLNDEDRFNITNRLVLLFPKIDVDPVDGFVSEHELTQWNLKQAETEVMHRSQRDMDVHDKNKDGLLSFAEYEPPSWARSSGKYVSSIQCDMLAELTTLFSIEPLMADASVVGLLRYDSGITLAKSNEIGP